VTEDLLFQSEIKEVVRNAYAHIDAGAGRPAAERLYSEEELREWTPSLRELSQGSAQEPDQAEVVAELVRFMREVVREMGEERSVGFLRKFYGWYLRGLPDAKSVKPELTSAPTVAEAEAALLRFCPAARAGLAEHEAEIALLPDSESDRLLDLPISIYGGG
jgi:tRNA-dihydrouridine synthase